jgi:lysophospholipase L1-like esterase
VRIVAIGGSTTEETFTDDESTWVHRLQLALAGEFNRPVEVINAGVRGLRALHHAPTLKHILPLQPDLVIFLLGANDWQFDIYERFGHYRSLRRLFPDTLIGRFARIQYNRAFPPPTEPEQQVVPAYPFKPRSLEREPKISWLPEQASEQYLVNLRRISEICRANKLTCIFLTQPTAYHADASQDVRDSFIFTPAAVSYTLTFESMVHIAQVYNSALIEFAKERAHPICDLASQIAPTAEYFYDDMHFTLAGSARVATVVTDCVKPLVAALP